MWRRHAVLFGYRSETESCCAAGCGATRAGRDPKAKARVEKILLQTDSTIDSVYGRALEKNINYIERLDQMVASSERRRNAVFHEIDRHRATFSRTLRDNVDEIENAEFKVIGQETDSPKIAVEEIAS